MTMGDSSEYFRHRAEQERAAADHAADPTVSHVHREMARLYREASRDGADLLERASLSLAG
jgi:hypothetical protein